jgi:hypothetical protein
MIIGTNNIQCDFEDCGMLFFGIKPNKFEEKDYCDKHMISVLKEKLSESQYNKNYNQSNSNYLKKELRQKISEKDKEIDELKRKYTALETEYSGCSGRITGKEVFEMQHTINEQKEKIKNFEDFITKLKGLTIEDFQKIEIVKDWMKKFPFMGEIYKDYRKVEDKNAELLKCIGTTYIALENFPTNEEKHKAYVDLGNYNCVLEGLKQFIDKYEIELD